MNHWVSRAIHGMEESPPIHLSEEAIEKGAFGLPLTTVGQFANGPGD